MKRLKSFNEYAAKILNKEEFYKTLLDLHKKCGQGLSGIVKEMGPPEYTRYLNELIADGLVKCCDTGGSIGHPESNKFYMPTTGHNVWEDDGGEYQRHKGRYLEFVRYYLGISDHLTKKMMDKNPALKSEYHDWLNRNQDELEIMKNL